MAIVNKVIIVEGKSDKKRVQQVIAEPANIICTHGTMSIDKIDNMIETLYDKQVYVLADSDDEGEKIRKWFKRYLSESEHIYVDKTFCEVAKCPKNYLAHEDAEKYLQDAHDFCPYSKATRGNIDVNLNVEVVE